MAKFKVFFSDKIVLTYNLLEEEIVSQWIPLIKSVSLTDLCPTNHYIGYVSDEVLQNKINRFYQLADQINERSPNEIETQGITIDNWHSVLNSMHTHFPRLKNDVNYQDIWPLLTEYNDLLHNIESALLVKYGDTTSNDPIKFRITLDFNKSNCRELSIPDSAYRLFDGPFAFGDLKLHYPHVGRHAQELLWSNDMTCPKNQFIPQRNFKASVRLHFFDSVKSKEQIKSDWTNFYHLRGKDFWDIDINDPKIAFGYIKIGQLESISINNIDIEIPMNVIERNSFIRKIGDSSVSGWEIIEEGL